MNTEITKTDLGEALKRDIDIYFISRLMEYPIDENSHHYIKINDDMFSLSELLKLFYVLGGTDVLTITDKRINNGQ